MRRNIASPTHCISVYAPRPTTTASRYIQAPTHIHPPAHPPLTRPQFSLVSENEERRERRKVFFGFIKFVCVLIFGTVGFLLIETDNEMLGEKGSPKWVDALYWASITAATVG